MRATKQAPTSRARRGIPRPRTFHDGQGRQLDYLALLDLLRDHLDRGHPDSQEIADDLLTVAQKLNEVDIPADARHAVIDRLSTLDASRSILCWPDVEHVLHSTLSRLVTRLRHTHPPRRKPPRMPTALQRAKLEPRPAHDVVLTELRWCLRREDPRREDVMRTRILLDLFERMFVPPSSKLAYITELKSLADFQPGYESQFTSIIKRLEREHADYIR